LVDILGPNEPAASAAIFLVQALELKSKIRLVSSAAGLTSPRVGESCPAVKLKVPGIDIVGPLPADLQSPDLCTMFGSPAASEQPLRR
jgi:hypothetical protein